MKRPFLILASLVSVFIISTSSVMMKQSSGMAGFTGSPSEGTCGNCHSGGAGQTVVTISANPVFVSNQYVAGQTYTITVNVANTNFSKFGFGAEILNSSNVNAGGLTTALAGVQFLLASSGRNNATHTTAKAGTGSASFQFVWVAPANGNCTIYAAGNAVNGTGGTGGDIGGITSLALVPQLGTAISEVTKTGFGGVSIFPNPIISNFNIKYSLIDDGVVRAAVYDINGKEMYEISNEKQYSGTHTMNVNLPSDISKGVYFVKLFLNDKPGTQRLIIVQ